MARGWESKSVEDQIVSSVERKSAQLKPAVTAAERDAQSRKTGLMLSRTKVLGDIENARNDRHRALLQEALEYINRQIRTLEAL